VARQFAVNRDMGGIGALVAGGLAAVLASACCLGPLVLVSLGLGGAWLGNLAAMEPYRPYLAGVAGIALLLAYRTIFRPAAACDPGQVCAVPQARKAYRIAFWVVATLAVVALAFPYLAPLFY
jgi:mercuric ion transport protein